jgi:cytochrome c oxidase subunit I+III
MIFVGFNLTFFMMHVVGLLGQPRRIYTYPETMGWTLYNLLASFGSFIMAFGFALFAIDVALQIYLGRRTRRNPWGASTLEWAMLLPAPAYNFASQPPIADHDPLQADPGLPLRMARGDYYLAQPRHGWRETLGVHMTSGAPDQIILLPGNSLLPLGTAVMAGGFFLSVLAGVYWLAPVFLGGVTVCVWRWAWGLGHRSDIGALDAGCGTTLPIQAETSGSPGHWASLFTITADATLFGTLLFGYAYLWTIASGWPPPQLVSDSAFGGISAIVALGIACLALRKASVLQPDEATRQRRLGVGLALQAIALILLVYDALTCLPPPASHAYAATVAMLFCYAIVHVVLAALMAAFALARSGAGFMSNKRTADVRIASMWQDYAAIVAIVVLLITKLPAMLA